MMRGALLEEPQCPLVEELAQSRAEIIAEACVHAFVYSWGFVFICELK